MTLKLVAIDMDSTFLKDNKTYNEEFFKEILEALTDRGIKVVIASGNGNDKLRSYFTEEQNEVLYFAGDNGSQIYKGFELLHEEDMASDLIQEVEDYAKDFEDYELYVSTGDEAYVLKGSTKEMFDLINFYNENLYEVDSFRDLPSDKKVFKLCFVAYHPEITDKKEMMDQLNQTFSGLSALISGREFIDTISSQSGKGSAVKFFQERYGISENETIAFGDSLNDISMMESVYYSVAVKNADPVLKKHCRFLAPSNEEEGVFETLNTYLKTNTLDFLEKNK